MELVAAKHLRINNGRIVNKGDRFKIDSALGRVYLLAKVAKHPPREIEPEPEPDPIPDPAPIPQTYQTRVMTAETTAPIVPVKRPRGRPRKVRDNG